MFEVKFVVRDKGLPDVLRALEGLPLEPPVITPVASDTSAAKATAAEKPRPKKKLTRKPRSSTTADLFAAMVQVAKSSNGHVTSAQMQDWVAGGGAKRSTYYYHLQKLLADGALSKTNLPSTYKVKMDG